jgi:hypothetical protein
MDEHLREVGAVRLVLGLREDELDGGDDPLVVATSTARSPASTPAATSRQNARAFSGSSGWRKLTPASPSMQSIRTSASSSIVRSSSRSTRRIAGLSAVIEPA